MVYAIAFNNPFGDKIITGSFDKTCKVWNSETGELYHTLRGHATEIVCLSFNPQGNVIATGSMDNTAKLWDTETGTEIASLLGHTAEIVSLSFNQQGDKLITGSFDHTTKLWDVKSGRCIHTFQGRNFYFPCLHLSHMMIAYHMKESGIACKESIPHSSSPKP